MPSIRNFTTSNVKNRGNISKLLKLNILTDTYGPSFYTSKNINYTIDLRKNLINILDAKEIKLSLQIFTDVPDT